MTDRRLQQEARRRMKEKDIKYTQALREIKEEWAAKAVKTDNPREYYMGYNETPTSLEKP